LEIMPRVSGVWRSDEVERVDVWRERLFVMRKINAILGSCGVRVTA